MRKFFKFLTNRSFIVPLLILIQLVFFYFLIFILDEIISHAIGSVMIVLSLIVTLHIVNSKTNPNYKISWIILVLVFPIFGGAFYVFYHQWSLKKTKRARVEKLIAERNTLLPEATLLKTTYIKEESFLKRCGWMSYVHSETNFLSSGEELFNEILKEILVAQKYILLEFFIIKKGVMWEKLKNALIKKAEEGLEIKLLYDDLGTKDLTYFEVLKLKKLAIDLKPFNVIKAYINLSINHRDHRKIIVIDGKVAFTGGINIGDEYLNITKKFGHWHDAGLKITGLAVNSFVVMFFENWRFSLQKKELDIDVKKYFADYYVPTNGVVIPFADSPIDKIETTRDVYLNLISGAKKRIYITTPYLILEDQVIESLKRAAVCGIDVRIVIPSIPDKKIAYAATNSYVPELIDSGCKVYKYSPGFIHAKVLLFDDEIAAVGTTNLDYRSFHLHFENNVLVYKTNSIRDIEKFLNQTFAVSEEIKKSDKRGSFLYKLLQAILRIFAPLF